MKRSTQMAFSWRFSRTGPKPFHIGSRFETTRGTRGILSIRTVSGPFSPTLTFTSWVKGRTTGTTNGWVPTSQLHHGFRGVNFAVWAPNAQRVSVIGNFNHWDGRRHPMGNRGATGIWEIFIPDLLPGRGLQVRSQEPARRLPGREVRSLRFRRRIAAQDGFGRLGRREPEMERPRMACQAEPSSRVSTSRSRFMRCTWARGSGAAAASFSAIVSWPTSLSSTSSYAFHSCRADADHRASI